MLLSESLVCALESYDISGIKVACDASIKGKVSEYFSKEFNTAWLKALSEAEEKYKGCEMTKAPFTIIPKDYGFFISLGALEVRYCDGDYYDIDCGLNAFETSLKNMAEQFPGITYEGYVGYILSDVRSGEAFQREFSNFNSGNYYDFVGKVLENALSEDVDDSEFWDILIENLEANEDFEDTIGTLDCYSGLVDVDVIVNATDIILKAAWEYDEDLAEELAELFI